MKVMKFGGSSVGSGKRILHVAKIIHDFHKEDTLVIVVSAMYKVTDTLISIFKNFVLGQSQQGSYALQLLYDIHNQALQDLEVEEKEEYLAKRALVDLFRILRIHLNKGSKLSTKDYDYVISFGERFASLLLAVAVRKFGTRAHAINASELIIADDAFGNGRIYFKETEEIARKFLLPFLIDDCVPVVTGFFASTKAGDIVTLGRGGSDYTATILAHVLDAHEVILWKEVDGVYSADPQKNAQAKFYANLSYDEALLLAEKGAKILHPEAMRPVAAKGIVVRVKNTFRPEFQGTKIWNKTNNTAMEVDL